MIVQRTATFYPTAGVEHEWDLDSMVHTAYNMDGSVVSSVPFTIEEYESWWAARESKQAAETQTQRSIEDALNASLLVLTQMIEATDEQINANPAARIRVLARTQRRMLILMLRRFDQGTGNPTA